MASFTLQLAPASLEFKPSQAQLSETAKHLESYISWGEVKAKTFSKPQLITSGAAFESLTCPLCQTNIDRFGDDDHGEWWCKMEDALYESADPLNEELSMPCCAGVVKASLIADGKEAVFSNCLIRVNEYELESGKSVLDDEQIKKLVETFGTTLVQIIEVG